MSMSVIKHIDVFPLRLPMIRGFAFASGSAGCAGDTAPHVLVRVTDDAGHVGWGEGRPVPGWSYETLESVTTTLRVYLAPAALGCEIHDRVGLHQRMHAALGRGPSTGQPIAKAALDMAGHDLAAQAMGLPLRAYLGGAGLVRPMPLSYTVTAHETDSAADEVAAARGAGFAHFNFKVAMGGPDAALARAIRRAAGADAFIWADANQGYTLPQARRAAAALADAGVDVLEQPLPADRMNLMRQLRPGTALPLAIDEASVSPADFFGYAAEGLVDYLVLKVTRSGGLGPSLQQIMIAEAAGLKLLVSGLTDGLLTKLAALQLAAVFGYAGPAALNGSQFTDESALFPGKAQLERGGAVLLPSVPGVGVAPESVALDRFRCDV